MWSQREGISAVSPLRWGLCFCVNTWYLAEVEVGLRLWPQISLAGCLKGITETVPVHALDWGVCSPPRTFFHYMPRKRMSVPRQVWKITQIAPFLTPWCLLECRMLLNILKKGFQFNQMYPRVSWLRHHLFTQNLQATCSWEILFTICICLRPKSTGKAVCQVCRCHSKSITEKKSPDIMTQNVVWGGALSWDHSLCIPWDRSSLWEGWH